MSVPPKPRHQGGGSACPGEPGVWCPGIPPWLLCLEKLGLHCTGHLQPSCRTSWARCPGALSAAAEGGDGAGSRAQEGKAQWQRHEGTSRGSLGGENRLSATRGAEGRDRLWAPPHSHSLGALRSAGVHTRSSHLFLPGMEVSRADHLQNHAEAVSFLALGQAQSCSPCSALTPRYQTSPCSPALTPPSATTKLQLCL